MSDFLFEQFSSRHLTHITAKLFAPQSLILQHKQILSQQQKKAAVDLASQLQPGDIILVSHIQTQTPGDTYSFLRTLSQSYFDHVSVFLNKDFSLQVGPPIARLIPSYLFLTMQRRPYIVRLPEDKRENFIKNIKKLKGKKYYYNKALSLWASLSLFGKTKIVHRVDNFKKKDRIICTDAILAAVPNIEAITQQNILQLDFRIFGSYSINDILSLTEAGVFREVQLPFPFNYLNKQTKSFHINTRKLMRQASVLQTLISLRNLNEVYLFIRQLRKVRYLKTYLSIFAIAKYLIMKQLPGYQLFDLVSTLWPKL